MEYRIQEKTVPKKLKLPSINEATLEFRFETTLPGEVLKGRLFEFLLSIAGKAELVQVLPEGQLPEPLLAADESLKYRPIYRYADKNFLTALGMHSIAFSVLNPYPGWEDWKKSFESVLINFLGNDFVADISRVGLRYIDFFEGNIIDNLNLSLTLNSQKIDAQTPFECAFSVDYEGYKSAVRVNSIDFSRPDGNQITVIDVDCYKNGTLEKEAILKNMDFVLEDIHNRNKEIFFSVLKKDFISALE